MAFVMKALHSGLMVLASLSATTLPAAPAPPARSHHDQGARQMEITRKDDLRSVAGPAQFFTGKATITGQFQREEPSRVSGAIVRFEAGARTAWHSHPLGQTLIVADGVGWTQVEGGPILEFHAGDILWC